MKIQFTEEEIAVGNGVKAVVENAPTAVVKIGAGIVGAGASVGWGLAKSVFGAGKVMFNSANVAYNAYQQAAEQQRLAMAQYTQNTEAQEAELEDNTRASSQTCVGSGRGLFS